MSRTRWVLEPAQAYDAIAFVNILTGDPFYVDSGYRADYERYQAHLGPAEKQALSHLTQRVKVEAHQLIYPLLCLIFSGADVHTLTDLRRIVQTDEAWQALRRAYAARPTAEPAELQAFDDVRADLRVLFDSLHTSGWEQMWTATALPRVRAYIAEHAEIRSYDVVGADERVLGRRLDVPSLTAYVMAYGSPHGVRVQGWRFLTDIQYPAPVLIRTALHELLHPPFPRQGELDRVLNTLGQDPYFQRLVQEHNPAFGYTTAEGLIEEDCATAVHIYNTEKFGLLGQPAVDYFRKSDDGIHVLAFLLSGGCWPSPSARRADTRRWSKKP